MPVHALEMVIYIFLNVCLPAAFIAIVRCFFFVVINTVTVQDGLSLKSFALCHVFTMAFCVMREHVGAKTPVSDIFLFQVLFFYFSLLCTIP